MANLQSSNAFISKLMGVVFIELSNTVVLENMNDVLSLLSELWWEWCSEGENVQTSFRIECTFEGRVVSWEKSQNLSLT